MLRDVECLLFASRSRSCRCGGTVEDVSRLVIGEHEETGAVTREDMGGDATGEGELA